ATAPAVNPGAPGNRRQGGRDLDLRDHRPDRCQSTRLRRQPGIAGGHKISCRFYPVAFRLFAPARGRRAMSSPLAIGAVSAVLRNLLDDGLIEAGAAMGSTVNVTAVAPDTINLENPEEPPRLNLFLHQVTPNSGWRNRGLPSRSATSGERLTNAPL